jgi:probable HAF family extracellular repeat protein
MRRTAITKLALMTLTALAVFVEGAAHPAQAGIAYILKDLGALGGTESQGWAVNDSGQVTGNAYLGTTKASPLHAFLSAPGGGPLTDLGTLSGGTESAGYGVNASGQVAGSSDTAGGTIHAFLSGPGGGPLQDLGTLPGGTFSFGRGVNASGQVTGDASTASGAEHAFLSGPGGGPLQDLGTLPGGTFSFGRGVNASGQVTGDASIPGGAEHAFLSGPGGGPLQDLGTLGGINSRGLGVNAAGQVTGYSDIGGGFVHAFLSGPNGGALQDLGTLPGGVSSVGIAVNASGQVAGASNTAPFSADHAFLYSDGQMLDLNDLIAPGSGLTLVEANGISDTGYIAGTGNTPDGQQHAFLLIPVQQVTCTCTVAVPVLWPPNHELINVGLGVDVKPADATLHLQVYANDGATAADADIGPGTLLLRAERQGGGQGRVYLIVATATDAAGQSGFDVCTVVVPHDQSDASLAAVQAAAAAAESYYREFQAAPTGYALLGQAAPTLGVSQRKE